jgi:uncharacterized protein (TIGR03435 family)
MKRLLLTAGLLTATTLAAQQAPSAPAATTSPTFEVASIKRNTSGAGFQTISMQPERLTFVNFPVRQLIVRAYQVQPFQVLGGPSWITGDRFDVTTKADANATPEQLNLMLQAMLADRFKLKVHKETRQSDIYRLVLARADGKLGDSIKPAAVNCAAMRGRPGGPGPGPGGPAGAGPVAVPAPRAGGPQPGPGGGMGGCQMMVAPGRLQVAGQPMSTFANQLAQQLGRPVRDETGLTGSYDFTLTFMPETGGRAGVPPIGAPDLPPIDPNAPSLPTALQEQLGLKLETTKGPIEMIVIDSIDQPTEN